MQDIPAEYTATDLTAAVGDVRLLVPDVAAPQLLDDGQLQRLLRLNGAPPDGTVEARAIRLATAEALDVIASSEVMVTKVIRSQDLSKDGAKVAAELRARATTIRDRVEAADHAAAAEASSGVLEYGWF